MKTDYLNLYLNFNEFEKIILQFAKECADKYFLRK